MNEAWGRALATNLLERVQLSLASEAREHDRWHIPLLRSVGALAVVVPVPIVSADVTRLLADAPDRAFHEGIITNIEDRSRFIQRDLPSADEAASVFPEYPRSELPRSVQDARDPHIAAVLAGDIAGAVTHATTPLFLEEVASTCAVAGDLEACVHVVQSADFPVGRKMGPLMVLCIESFRRDDSARAEQLLEEVAAHGDSSWTLVQLSAGLFGREPWGGYPYPDY